MSRPVSGSRKRPTRKASNARRPTRKASDARRPAPPSARSVALDVIRRVTDEGAYSNLTLARTLARAGLSERDAAFATELVYGTLRRLIPIDHALAPLLERPIDTAPKGGRAALRLGAYQLRYLRVPAHAAVSETVALVDQRHRGFVNAVLRRFATLEPQEPEGASDLAVSLRTGLAEWAVRELRRVVALGRGDRTRRRRPRRTGAAHDPREHLPHDGRRARTRAGRGRRPDRTRNGAPGLAGGRLGVARRRCRGSPRAGSRSRTRRRRSSCGRWIRSRATGCWTSAPAPGGKTGHLACLVGPKGRVVAADVSLARLELVRATVERLGVSAELLVQDGRRPAVREGFDRILVDAPCSGIGSARRRPELLWRARKDELAGLARLQVGIATAAAGLLRPGGRLVYSVCTFPRAETDAACDAIVRRAPELEPVEIAGPDGPAERIRLWPHRHGCDAMFVAAFRGRATPRG